MVQKNKIWVHSRHRERSEAIYISLSNRLLRRPVPIAIGSYRDGGKETQVSRHKTQINK